MGGRCGSGTVEVRGEEGREVDPGLDLERGRALGGRDGDIGRIDNTGVGAWTCIDMARVGRARSGTRPRLIEGLRGEGTGEDLGAGVMMGASRGQRMIANAERWGDGICGRGRKYCGEGGK